MNITNPNSQPRFGAFNQADAPKLGEHRGDCDLNPKLTELILRAPWREAVTYRDTWPHQYVLLEKDNQRELLAAICERFRAGEGLPCRFFRVEDEYLFIGECKYWLMTDYSVIDPSNDDRSL